MEYCLARDKQAGPLKKLGFPHGFETPYCLGNLILKIAG